MNDTRLLELTEMVSNGDVRVAEDMEKMFSVFEKMLAYHYRDNINNKNTNCIMTEYDVLVKMMNDGGLGVKREAKVNSDGTVTVKHQAYIIR